jgi:hypothetical protein
MMNTLVLTAVTIFGQTSTNGNLPSSNPSLKKVLVVLECAIALVFVFFLFIN